MPSEQDQDVTAVQHLPGWRTDQIFRRSVLLEHANLLFVIQLAPSGNHVAEPQFKIGDLQRWWIDMFGTFRLPTQDAWYLIREHGCETLGTVLFDAWGFAEAYQKETYRDPRRKRFFPSDLPNITELLAEGPGERCEICMCDWEADRPPEGPLLHDWETACRHWACKQCWLSLAKSSCPWCGWDLYRFLFELNADRVQAAELQADVSSFYIGDPCEDVSILAAIQDTYHVGWLHGTGKTDIEKHFERVARRDGVDNEEFVLFVCRINGYAVALYNGFGRDESLLRTWHVICRRTQADTVLSLLACLFPRVSKSRVFQHDAHW